MDNITMIDCQVYDGVVISTRGAMTDAKVAKLNNDTKRKNMSARYEDFRMSAMSKALNAKKTIVESVETLLQKVGITMVNHPKKAHNNGAKKLRTNKEVLSNNSSKYEAAPKIDVVPMVVEKSAPVVEIPKVEAKEEPKVTVNPFEPNISTSREEVHGRHERTGEIPVATINETVKDNSVPVSNPMPPISRSERNSGGEFKQESMGGNMDQYNKLVHGNDQSSDISKQIQESEQRINLKQEQVRQIDEELSLTKDKLVRVKEKIIQKQQMQEQQKRQKLEVLKQEESEIDKDILGKTSPLNSLVSEVAKYEAELRAYDEDNIYGGYGSR